MATRCSERIFSTLLILDLLSLLRCQSTVLQIEPDSVMVKHGSSVSVNCSTNLMHKGMGWEATQGAVPLTEHVQLVTWKLESLQDWDIKPICYANFRNGDQGMSELNITVYKLPDSVTISTVGHSGPIVEGNQYELQCDVQNVAPIHLLTVNWYKGETLLANKSFTDLNKKPVNESVTLHITPNRTDNGAQYRCEAKLQLGPDGPHPAPTVISDPFTITVHYKPEIYRDKLPAAVPVFDGYPEMIVCEADGNPKPTIKWLSGSKIISENGNLTITNSDGIFTCSATNVIGTDFKDVQVILKVDYLPVIAGIVAFVVVIISIFFVFIYCIYYKNNKMGRYSLHNAKPNPQNGDVAQNGKDSSLPMKKIPMNHV